MFLDWKNQYCENDYTTQSNLQIQCNAYQIINGIFHRTRAKKNTQFVSKCSWEIDGETVETVSDFIFLGLQNHWGW